MSMSSIPSSSEPIYASTNHHTSGKGNQGPYLPVFACVKLVPDSFPMQSTLHEAMVTKGVFKSDYRKPPLFQQTAKLTLV